MTFTPEHIDEIASQLDSSAPYYLPAVLTDFKSALETLAKVQELREWLERNEGNGKRTADELLLLLVVKGKMDALGLGTELKP